MEERWGQVWRLIRHYKRGQAWGGSGKMHAPKMSPKYTLVLLLALVLGATSSLANTPRDHRKGHPPGEEYLEEQQENSVTDHNKEAVNYKPDGLPPKHGVPGHGPHHGVKGQNGEEDNTHPVHRHPPKRKGPPHPHPQPHPHAVEVDSYPPNNRKKPPPS